MQCLQVATMAEVGGRIETPSSVYNAKTAFMDIQASQGQAHHQSGNGSPNGVAGGSGFGSPTPGTVSSTYHHQARLSPPPVAGYHHHMHGPSHHHHHQQSQTDVPGSGFMSSNPSVQVSLTPSTTAVPNCCCSKGPLPYWSNPPFLIFDIRALCRSIMSTRASECQK